MDKNHNFLTGCLLDENSILLASTPKGMDIFTEYSKITIWNNKEDTPLIKSYEISGWAQCAIRFISNSEGFNGAVILTSSGKVFFYQEGKIDVEFIEDANNWGYQASITEIEGQLYVCGARGQVYKRIGKNKWVHHDNGLISSKNMSDVMQDISDNQPKEGQNIEDWIMGFADFNLDIGLSLWAIQGTSNDNIYVCGSMSTDKGYKGVIFYYDGKIWTEMKIPETDTLGVIFIDDDGSVFIGGGSGYLLRGDNVNGFKEVSEPAYLMNNSFMAKFLDIIYIGTDEGLYQFKNDQMEREQKITAELIKINPDNETEAWSVERYNNKLLLIGNSCVYLYDLLSNKLDELFYSANPDIITNRDGFTLFNT
ncbi:hypothetical protein [Budvicia aquatica]|uniref:Uncharacterized protein n=1 Tax=Budvicia aquatica TaxID=82979 RepID=A0A2C6CPC2_9GAMM|nr:hypothetical protein [Budvicia aquatica]PHI28519.1 hypothetical protein CRN84_03825 [Budvicia aquatica]VFS46463.1 Uncharacterised protein [Budvicia aquatica]